MRIGQKTNKLVLVEQPFQSHCGGRIRLKGRFRCECGKLITALIESVKYGNTKSCGCIRITHGVSRHPLYVVWTSMVRRCGNEADERYEHYGGRGIRVCAEWEGDPKAFVEWGISAGWSEGLQIDRINNDGDYEPANCRFVTAQENANNTRANVLVIAFGQQKTIAEWLRDKRCVVKRETLYQRIRRGVDAEQAITKPAYTLERRDDDSHQGTPVVGTVEPSGNAAGLLS